MDLARHSCGLFFRRSLAFNGAATEPLSVRCDATAADNGWHRQSGGRSDPMLGPVRFELGGSRSISPLHIAPWGDDARWPGLMRALRGEWPCLPFGTAHTPSGLPQDFKLIASSDDWNHGYLKSHDSASSRPPPSAFPESTEIVGTSSSAIRRNTRFPARMNRLPIASASISPHSPISAPLQK